MIIREYVIEKYTNYYFFSLVNFIRSPPANKWPSKDYSLTKSARRYNENTRLNKLNKNSIMLLFIKCYEVLEKQCN